MRTQEIIELNDVASSKLLCNEAAMLFLYLNILWKNTQMPCFRLNGQKYF